MRIFCIAFRKISVFFTIKFLPIINLIQALTLMLHDAKSSDVISFTCKQKQYRSTCGGIITALLFELLMHYAALRGKKC